MSSLEASSNPVYLAWRNLHVNESTGWFRSKTKPILRHVTGQLEFNTLTAFLGPSGAGKTTLLHYITGNRHHGLGSQSELYANCEDKVNQLSIGFIEQNVNESIIANMTVGEALKYAFCFKNGRSCEKEMKEHIKTTISYLLLEKSILSRPFEKCSGGEQKRVAVAQELMSVSKLPNLLVLDEPTTGLDSTAALLLIDSLRNLVQHHRMAIALSIHLPNDQVLSRFDQLYILARGGLCIYSGPPQNLRDTLQHELDIVINEDTPPIEKWLQIASNGVTDNEVRHLSQQTYSKELTKQTLYLAKMTFLSKGIKPTRKCFNFKDLFYQIGRLSHVTFVLERNLFLFQIAMALVWFTLISMIFDPSMVKSSACYSLETYENNSGNQTCTKALQDDAYVQSYISYMSFVFIFYQIFVTCINALFIGPKLKVLHHEHRNAWYSLSVLFWSFSAVHLLELTIHSIFCTLLIYFGAGHTSIDQGHVHWSRLGHMILFYWLMGVYFQAVGQMCGAFFPHRIDLALMLVTVFGGSLTLTNGLMMTIERMDSSLIITSSNLMGAIYISKSLLWTIYGIDRCQENEFSGVLTEYNIDPDQIYWNMLQVVANTVLCRSVILIALYLRFVYLRPVRLQKPNSQLGLIEFDETQFVVSAVQHRPIELQKLQYELKEQVHFCKGKLIMAWRNLTLFRPHPFLERRSIDKFENQAILRNLNGNLSFGTLNALMGTSGAGKTSLLKVLNGRLKRQWSKESEFYLSRFVPISTCFLNQEVSHHLWQGLTTQQGLLYAARLKNCNDGNKVDYNKIVTNLLDQFQLSDIANTPVHLCSGGERKRIALAQELTSAKMPNLICIDEPASGLDSNSAYMVISCLSRLVRQHPITIVASVHQPNYEVLHMFDQIYTLARGGVCIYQGSPNGIEQHLNKLIMRSSNLNFAVEELIYYSTLGHENATVQQLVELCKHKTSDEAKLDAETQYVLDGIEYKQVFLTFRSIWHLFCRYYNYFCQFIWLHWSMYLFIYFVFALMLRNFYNSKIALASGCINVDSDFNQTCSRTPEQLDEQSDLMNNFRYGFFVNCNFMLMIIVQSGLSLLRDYNYWRVETRNQWYNNTAFYLVQSIGDLITLIPLVLVYVYICNIYESVQPGIYWRWVALLLLATLTAQTLGHLSAILSRGNLSLFIMNNSIYFMIAMLLGSQLFSPLGYRFVIFRVLVNFSLPRYVSDAMMVLQYGFERCNPRTEFQAILYQLGIEHDASYLRYCFQMLAFNCIFWRAITIMLVVKKSNSTRKLVNKPSCKQQSLSSKSSITSLPGLTSLEQLRIQQINV